MGQELGVRTGNGGRGPAGLEGGTHPGGSNGWGAKVPRKGQSMADLLEVYRTWVKLNLRRDEGQALVEYALILFLIAVVCIGVLTALGKEVRSTLNAIANAM